MEESGQGLLHSLPRSDFYEQGWLLPEQPTHVLACAAHRLIALACTDGHVHFWRKTFKLFEPLRKFRAHSAPATDVKLSADNSRLFTLSAGDRSIRVFDLAAVEMIEAVRLDQAVHRFLPLLNETGQFAAFFAAARDGPAQRVRREGSKLVWKVVEGVAGVEEVLHARKHSCLVFVCRSRRVEYIDARSLGLATRAQNALAFNSKFETDLLAFATKGAEVVQALLLPSELSFLLLTADRCLRLFCTESARLQLCVAFGAAQLRQLPMFSGEGERPSAPPERLRVAVDESERFVAVPSELGLLLLSLQNGEVVARAGRGERDEAWTACAVYQGEQLFDAAGSAGIGGVRSQESLLDPLLLALSARRPLLAAFSARAPPFTERRNQPAKTRDVQLEPTKASENRPETALAELPPARGAVISTSLGDIHIDLLSEHAPQAVLNFCGHARSGYYFNCVFHRVVPGYVQTGDPLNTGAGGESIWGRPFADEISPELRHDRPFTVSMANSGPNSNGSQFFITTMPSPWLDGRHTIFARVRKGMEVVKEIEALRTDNFQKPVEDVSILGIILR